MLARSAADPGADVGKDWEVKIPAQTGVLQQVGVKRKEMQEFTRALSDLS